MEPGVTTDEVEAVVVGADRRIADPCLAAHATF
jgi:hypothetical protein